MNLGDSIKAASAQVTALKTLYSKIATELPVANLGDSIKATQAGTQSLQTLYSTLAAEVPAPPTAPYQLVGTPPLLLDFSVVPSRIAVNPGLSIYKTLVQIANSTTQNEQRMVCSAFLYRLGAVQLNGLPVISGVTYAKSAQQYGDQAISDFLVLKITGRGDGYEESYAGIPALVYSWTRSRAIATSQQAAMLAIIKPVLDNPNAVNVYAGDGYNNMGGDVMCLALATAGDFSGTDYVAKFWSQWNDTTVKTWNWANVKKEMPDYGNVEGWGYYVTSMCTNFLTWAIWRSATGGNTFLDIGFLQSFPFWAMHNFEAGFPTHSDSGLTKTNRWYTCYENYSGGFVSGGDVWQILTACTGLPGPYQTLAAYIMQQCGNLYGAGSDVGRQAIYGLLVGDPTVAPQSPTQLNLPLQQFASLGRLIQVSDWSSTRRTLYVCNDTWNMRAVAPNQRAIYKGAIPLLIYGGQQFAHDYEPGNRTPCGWVFCKGSQYQLVSRAANTDKTPGIKEGTFVINPDGSVDCEGKPNYTPVNGGNPALLTSHKMHLTFTPDLTSQTSVDTFVLDSTLTPHFVANFDQAPQLSLAGVAQPVASFGRVQADTATIIGVDGVSKAIITFPFPVWVTPIGGIADYFKNFDGTTPANVDPSFPKDNLADENRLAGLWRIEAEFPNGSGSYQIAIQVP